MMYRSTTAKSSRNVRWDDSSDDTDLRPQSLESFRSKRGSRPNTDSLRPNTGNARSLSETFLPRIQASPASLREDSIPSSMLTERRQQGHIKASIGEIRSELRKQDHKEAEWGGYGRKVRPGSRAGTGGRKPHKVPPWEISEEVKDALATLRQFREMSARSIPMISNRLIHHIGLSPPAVHVTNYCRRVNFALIKDSPMLTGWIKDIEDRSRVDDETHGPHCLAVSDLETAEGTFEELMDLSKQYTVIANGVQVQAGDLANILACLHSLSLSDNGLGDSGVFELCAVLQKNNTLERFCCHYNHLTDIGAGMLADHLAHNKTLKSLRLPFNRIGDAGGESLAELIGPCKCANVMLAAIKEGQYDVVDALIKHGHPVNPFYSEEDPLLVMAASVQGSEEILELLLDSGADIECRDAKGRTAFLAAAQEGVVDAMEVLHVRGANVEARDKEGRSALLLAAMGGHSNCTQYMVEKINDYPLRLVLTVARLRDFAYDPLAQMVPPSPANSQGGQERSGGILGMLRAGSSLRRPSNASQSSNESDMQRGGSVASAALEGGSEEDAGHMRRNSSASVELGGRSSSTPAEPKRRGSNYSDEGGNPTRGSGRKPRKDSLLAMSNIGQLNKPQRRRTSSAERPPDAESGSVMDKLRQTGTAMKKKMRKASLALENVMPGSLMREYKAGQEELFVEAFLLFRFAGTEVRTKTFKVGENGTAEIKEVIAFKDMLAGPSPLFTMDLWVIHPMTGEEEFAGMCMLSASELLIERKPMDATWNDVADDTATRTCSVQLSMRIFPEMMFEESKLGEMVLVEAARCGSTELVHYFGAMGADLNCRDGNGNTPLILAAKEGRWHTVKSLLRSKVDVAAENRAGLTALAMAERLTGDGEEEEEEEEDEASRNTAAARRSDIHTVSELLQAYMKSKQGVPVSIKAFTIGQQSRGDNLTDPLDFLKDLYKGSYEPAKLTVGVRQARNLPQADVTGKADPFVKVTLNHQTKESKVLKRTLDPEWEEDFVFDDQTLGVWAEQELLVEVFDWNMTKAAEFMGMCKVPVADMLRLQPRAGEGRGEGWYRLRAKNDMLVKAERALKKGESGMGGSMKRVESSFGGSTTSLGQEAPQDSSLMGSAAAFFRVSTSKSRAGDADRLTRASSTRSGAGGTDKALARQDSGGSAVERISSGDAEVRLSFRVAPGRGRHLQVEVLQARGLPSMDGEGARPNASCSLSLSRTTVSTETVKRDSNPRWGHGFRFEMKGTDAILELQLLELLKAPGENLIGVVDIPLVKIMALIECGLEEVWIELEDEEGSRLKGDNGESAAIRLRFKISSSGDHMSDEDMTEVILKKAKTATPKISDEAKFLLRRLKDGTDPLVKTLGLFERLRAECGGFIGVEQMLEAADELSMEVDEIEALKRRYFAQLAGSPGCSDPGHFCRLLGLGGLWERDQKERLTTGASGRSGRSAKSVREKPEVVVNQGVQAKVGLKVVLRKAALEEDPALEKQSGGGAGTIVWVDPEDTNGDGHGGDICQVRWERTGVKADYRTGFEGDYRLAVAGTGAGAAPPTEETVIRRDVPAEVGQRVVLSKIAMLLDPQLRKASMDGPGTIVWVDTEDKDGDGDTGDVCQVVWDATGKKGLYNTGYQGDFRLALYEPSSKITARQIAGITGMHSTTVLRELVLDDNLIGKFGVTQLAQSLRGNHTLERLSMRRNRAEASGANEIGEAMKENRTLTDLRLAANIIGDDGLLEISHALRDRNGAPIRFLDLEENGIGAIGSKYIARALIKNRTLTWLSLKNNLVGADGAPLLEQGLRRSASLLELDLDRNVLGDAGMKCLARAMRHLPAMGKKRAQPANRVLRILHVAQNNLSDDSVEFILEGLYKNYSLHTVHLHTNQISKEAIQKILDALAENVHEAKLEAGVIALQKIYRGRKQRLATKAQKAAAERAKRRELPPSEAEVMLIEEEAEDVLHCSVRELPEVEEAEEKEWTPPETADVGPEAAAAASEGEEPEAAGAEEEAAQARAREEDEVREEDEAREAEEEIRLGGQSEEQNDLLLAATKAHMFNMGEALLAEQRAAEEMASESSERVKRALENYEFLDGRLKWLLERPDSEEEELEDAAQRLREAEQEAVEAMAAAEKAEEAARKCLDAMDAYHAFEREESEMAEAIQRMKGGAGREEGEEEAPPALVKRVSLEAWIMEDGQEHVDAQDEAAEEAPEQNDDLREGSVTEEEGIAAKDEEEQTIAADPGVSDAMEKGFSVVEHFSKLQAVLGTVDATVEDENSEAEDIGKMQEQVAEFNRRQEEAMAALKKVEEEMEHEVGGVLQMLREAEAERAASPPKTAAVTEAEAMTARVKSAVLELQAVIARNDEEAIAAALRQLEEAEQLAAEAIARAEKGRGISAGEPSPGEHAPGSRRESLESVREKSEDDRSAGTPEDRPDGRRRLLSVEPVTMLFVAGERLHCTLEGFGAPRRVVGRVCRARPSRAQRDLDNASDMRRRIAVVDRDLPGVTRGAVSDVTKVERCVKAGAAAVVLVHVGRGHGMPEPPLEVGEEVACWPEEWRVPVVSVREEDGASLVDDVFASIAEVTLDLETNAPSQLDVEGLVSLSLSREEEQEQDAESMMMLPNQTQDWTSDMYRAMQSGVSRASEASSSVSDGEEGATPILSARSEPKEAGAEAEQPASVEASHLRLDQESTPQAQRPFSARRSKSERPLRLGSVREETHAERTVEVEQGGRSTQEEVELQPWGTDAHQQVTTAIFVAGRRLHCTLEGFGALRKMLTAKVCHAMPSRAQRDLDNSSDMRRRIAVVDRDLPGVTRGAVSDVTKVERCVKAGAAAVVLVHVGRGHGMPEPPLEVGEEVACWPEEWRVPVVSVREEDGASLVDDVFASIAEVTVGAEEPVERLLSRGAPSSVSEGDEGATPAASIGSARSIPMRDETRVSTPQEATDEHNADSTMT